MVGMGEEMPRFRLLRRILATTELVAVVTVVAVMLSALVVIAGGVVPAAVGPVDELLGPSPDLKNAVRAGLSEPSRVVAADGTVLGRFEPEERFLPIEADDIPESVRDAVLAAEDEAFLQHAGIDVVAIARAALTNLRNGGVEQGGSTITQQLVKNLFTGGDRSLDRKLDEAKVALQLERDYDKREILAAYLNTVFFGEGAIGVRAASRTYFRKPVEQLTLAEAAMLAGVIPAPSVYNPRRAPDAAEARRQLVLDRLLESGLASEEEVEAARPAPVVHPPRQPVEQYPYFLDYVRRWLLDTGRVSADELYQGGLTVETTLDPGLQDAALAASARHLPDPGHPSASVVVLDPRSGAVRALVGGRDWTEERVNLALGAKGGGSGQQPGSSFKPVVLALAYERGASSEDLVPAPQELAVGDEGHVIENYNHRGYGEVTLADAIRRSINTSFAGLGLELGLRDIAGLARDLGLTSIPTEGLGASLAIGAYEVSPLHMATAYGVFANDGLKVPARPVRRIVGPDGEVRQSWGTPNPTRVLAVDTARLVTHSLRGVIENGTGKAADLGRPAAGKTGTTNDYRDAWFVGYTPHLVASVWVGYAESNQPMRDVAGLRNVTGGSLPARIWHDVMTAAHHDLPAVAFEPAPVRPRNLPPTTTSTIPPTLPTLASTTTSTSTSTTTTTMPRSTTTAPPAPSSTEPPPTTTTTAQPTTTTTTVPKRPPSEDPPGPVDEPEPADEPDPEPTTTTTTTTTTTQPTTTTTTTTTTQPTTATEPPAEDDNDEPSP